jgi:hypothetical protein
MFSFHLCICGYLQATVSNESVSQGQHVWCDEGERLERAWHLSARGTRLARLGPTRVQRPRSSRVGKLQPLSRRSCCIARAVGQLVGRHRVRDAGGTHAASESTSGASVYVRAHH